VREDFAALARAPDASIDVLEASLLIAREEYPALDAAACRARVDELARAFRGPADVAHLNDHFFNHLGFRGNTDDYYDPRNSYLNEVLERRTGIPITLAVLYCEVARRAGLPTAGIGFPGHFLARVGDAFVDCFHGRVLDREGCRGLLASMYGDRVAFHERLLADSPPRDILERMLNNLRGVYAQRADWPRAVRFADLAVALHPDRPELRRDRAMALLRAEEFGRAVGDLEDYLERAPEAGDADVVREHLSLAKKLLARVN
jgi:regulator of sirC expression with transglutaminase-like and TPR domain